MYEFEGFLLDPSERLLTRDGVPVPLSPKAFETLIVLVSNSGHLLTKDELMRAIWADAVVEENNLDKTISALRKALGESGAERKLIETVRGHGYRLNAAITEVVADQAKTAPRKIPTNQATPTGHSISPLPQLDATSTINRASLPPLAENRDKNMARRSWRAKSLLGLAAVLSLAVAVAMWVWPQKERRGVSSPGIKVARLTNGGYIHNAVLSPDGKSFAYTEQNGATARLWLRQVAGGQSAMLVPAIEEPILGLTFGPDGQAIYFATLGQSNPQGALYRVPALGGPAAKMLVGIHSPVTFAPDGRRIAFIRAGKNESTSLILADITGDKEQIVLTHDGLERFGYDGPSWSSNGKEIACQLFKGLTQNSDEAWRIVGVDVQSGAQRMLTTQKWDGCGRIAWLRDGSGLVLVGTKHGESGMTSRDTVWFVSQPDGAIRRITTDLSRHFYRSVSVSDDGQSLLVLPFNRTSQIWSVEARGQGDKMHYDAASTVQLTTGTGDGRAGIVSLNDGRIVYVARTGEHVDLWRMNSNGSQQQQLTNTPPFLEEASAPSDGSFFVFASNHAGFSHLFRVNRDGMNLQQLTSGESREIDSDCSPDGHWIVYSSQSSQPGSIAPFKLWKIPAEGGVPISLTDHEAQTPHYSPDGRWISYISPGRVAIISADGGAPVKTFDVPNSVEWNIGYRWIPDAQGLTYIVKGKTFDNLWLQPLNGDPPHPLTDFNSGEIYNYAFSRNGQRLFLARGYSIRDVLLIREF
ncbi:MAG TPA: winged helix-turn-helix domain-containing protein [Blastocatellia bacterium]|nr:winged helix-turn-helix domain-containing protein [Blastocatellia bacterium]